MMFGRGRFGYGFGGCFGNGYMNNGWLMILLTLLLIALVVVIVYTLVRNGRNKSIKSSAMETLKMKYVQGEITEEEYLKRKELLERS